MNAGRSDPLAQLLQLPIGTPVRLTVNGRSWEGWTLPPDPLSSPRVVKLKVGSGYNVGVHVPEDARIQVKSGPPFGEGRSPPQRTDAPPVSSPKDGPPVLLLTTGGTIASRVDYQTGGVRPVQSPEDLADIYPGLLQDGPVEVRAVSEIFSEDMTPADWTRLAREVDLGFHQGFRGVVIAHGTDTLAYTAAALAFQFRRLPGPVVLVGAQRSIDRPSSDGPLNLLAAVRTARYADLGEVVVAMHHDPTDMVVDLHRGTRVRKMHSTRRDAFRSMNVPPLGTVSGESISLRPDHQARQPGPPEGQFGFGGRGALVWLVPGLTPEHLESACEDARGIILAGTGMGHAHRSLLPWIQATTQKGVVVGMTTQCLEGEVNPFVYARGRELQGAGVLYLGDMLPETAYVKLLWALGHSPDPARVKTLLTTPLAGEMSDRRALEQGGQV
jgi:glutamyl-tRNA(Gln) amidotransferase subunit D